MVFGIPTLPALPESKDDEDSLHVLFTSLGFDVNVHQNLKAEEMKATVEEYSCMDHKGRAFVLIILSHGDEGDVIYGTDGEKVEVYQLQDFFHATYCPSLAGIPKVFLIDAYQSGKNENIHNHHQTTSLTDSVTVHVSTCENAAYMFSSTCNFIQMLVEVITEADENQNFIDIIVKVAERVQNFEAQTIKTQTTLTKQYYIKRQAVIGKYAVVKQSETKINHLQKAKERRTAVIIKAANKLPSEKFGSFVMLMNVMSLDSSVYSGVIRSRSKVQATPP